jgi:hypothetical protein
LVAKIGIVEVATEIGGATEVVVTEAVAAGVAEAKTC